MKGIVELINVTKVYQQGALTVRALNGVTLSIEPGSFVSLHGPSGSGKTTLLNLIGGLDLPSSGEVWLAGRRVDELGQSEMAEFRLHHLGFVFQSYNLIPVLSAQENVEFVMQLQGISAAERRKRAMEILAEVGLSGMERRRPGELSGGQQQRVAVARAIVSRPDIVLADEPTANLDSKTAESLLQLMLKMNKEHGATFVFSTHDKLVMSYARRLIQLRDGAVYEDKIV